MLCFSWRVRRGGLPGLQAPAGPGLKCRAPLGNLREDNNIVMCGDTASADKRDNSPASVAGLRFWEHSLGDKQRINIKR